MTLSKARLYQRIDDFMRELGYKLDPEFYPIDSLVLARSFQDLEIKFHRFKDLNAYALLAKDALSTMVLNSAKSKEDINFDCMHELQHYKWHNKSVYQCKYSQGKIVTDSYYEWEANEGAAQALVPYQIFIPEYAQALRKLEHHIFDSNDFMNHLCKKFGVSPAVIEYRIKNLDYEIFQYVREGKSIHDLILLSGHEKRSRCIKVDSAKWHIQLGWECSGA